MPVVNIKLADLGKTLRGDVRGRKERALKALRLVVRTHGPRLAVEEVERASPKPVDRGTYRRGFQVADIKDGASLYNAALHAGVIEEGRRPGARQPPTAVIEAWLRRKLRVAIKEGRHAQMSPSAYRGVAFVIARAIGRRGLPAHHILAKVDARLRPLVMAEVQKALAAPGPP